MFNQNYKMFLTTLISIIFFNNTLFADVNLSVCGIEDDGFNASFDICYTSDEAIGGIQFHFDGSDSGYQLTGASGGAAGKIKLQAKVSEESIELNPDAGADIYYDNTKCNICLYGLYKHKINKDILKAKKY